MNKRSCVTLVAHCTFRLALAACAVSAMLPSLCAQPWELWKINAEGGGLARFADTPGYTCGSPDWSPDGKSIAFDTWRSGQTYSDSIVAVTRADGTQRRLLGPGAMPS